MKELLEQIRIKAIAEIEGYLTSRYHTAVFVSVMEEL